MQKMSDFLTKIRNGSDITVGMALYLRELHAKGMINNPVSLVTEMPLIVYAARYRNINVVELLLSVGADANALSKDGWSALQFAVSFRETKMVKILIDHGADANLQRGTNWSALHHAVRGKGESEAIVKLLIDANADVNWLDCNNWSALHCVALSGNVGIAKLLLNASIDINQRNNDGESALHHATLMGKTEMIKFLLDRSADINTQDVLGQSPLHICVLQQEINLDSIDLLLKAGARLDISNNDGLTVVDIAKGYADVYLKVMLAHALSRQNDNKML